MFPNSDTRFGFSSNQTSFLTLSRLDSIRYAIYSLLFPHTKGTVLLVRFQCVDTLELVLKHAEGMSLRCDVICALAYCGRHESSHIVKAHADCTDLTGFLCGWEISRMLSAGLLQRLTQIQRDSTRRLFVGICVNSWLKNLCKKIV